VESTTPTAQSGAAGAGRRTKAALAAVLPLGALVVLTVVSPWILGGVNPQVTRAITLIALLGSGAALLAQARSRHLVAPPWPFLALLLVGGGQLVRLPPGIHGALAPGSFRLWHPDDALAAEVLGMGTAPISVNPESTLRWFALVFGLLALAIAASPALAEERIAFSAVTAVSLGGLALSIYGVVARTAFGPLLYGHIAVPTVSPFGPFVSKNHFAGYVEMATLLGLGLATGLADRERSASASGDWVRSPRAWRVLLPYGGALAMALGVVASLSRGGLVSLVCGALAFGMVRRMSRHRRADRRAKLLRAGIALAGSLGLLLLLPKEAKERMLSLGGVRTEESGSFRLDTWRDALSAARASPFVGFGMGGFPDAFSRFKRGHGELRVEHAENDYLEMLVDGGLFGLGSALMTGFLLGGTAAKDLKESRARLRRGMGAGALAGMVALAVHSAFDFNLRIPSNALLFTFLGAVAYAAGPRKFLGRGAGFVLAISLFSSALVLKGTKTGPEAPSRRDLDLAIHSPDAVARDLRLSRAEEALKEFVRNRPAAAEAWLLLGWTRAARGDRPGGAALARYASTLDPSWQALRLASEELAAEAGVTP